LETLIAVKALLIVKYQLILCYEANIHSDILFCQLTVRLLDDSHRHQKKQKTGNFISLRQCRRLHDIEPGNCCIIRQVWVLQSAFFNENRWQTATVTAVPQPDILCP